LKKIGIKLKRAVIQQLEKGVLRLAMSMTADKKRRRRGMNKSLKTSRQSGKNLINFYFKEEKQRFELEKFSDKSNAGQDFSNESLRLKALLKRAVEKDFAPQSLVDSIRNGIRR
jgi:hypothetical protein